jgi:four helix bundle protein
VQRATGYRALKVWQRAMELTVASYDVVARLPKLERYDLGSQIRRCAVSVPANIAEGHARDHLGDYLQHLAVAGGSLAELQTLLLISEQLGYSTVEQLTYPLSLAEETERMLCGLRRVIRARRNQQATMHTPRPRHGSTV